MQFQMIKVQHSADDQIKNGVCIHTGCVRCALWTGLPSQLLWSTSVRGQAASGHGHAASCSVDMPMAAFRCGT